MSHFHHEHSTAAAADEQAILQQGEPLVGKEERETWPDGRVTWVSTTKIPWRDAQGNIIGVFGISRDITRAKTAELELQDALRRAQESEELFRNLLVSAPDGIVVADGSGTIRLTTREPTVCSAMRRAN